MSVTDELIEAACRAHWRTWDKDARTEKYRQWARERMRDALIEVAARTANQEPKA